MNALVIIIPKAVIAGRVAVTALCNIDSFSDNALEYSAVIRQQAAHMAGSAGHCIIQDHFVNQAVLIPHLMKTPFNICPFYIQNT